MSPEAVCAINASLWFVSALTFFLLSFVFGDKLLKKFAGAFILIGIAKFVLLYANLSVDMMVFWTMMLNSGASFLLIDGAQNGDRRYRGTKMWLVFSLILSVIVVQANPQHSGAWFSIGPESFAMTIGWLFASFRFFRGNRPGKYLECVSYDVLSAVFLIRAVFAVVLSIVVSNNAEVFVHYIDSTVALLIIAFGILLGFERHKINIECGYQIEYPKIP